MQSIFKNPKFDQSVIIVGLLLGRRNAILTKLTVQALVPLSSDLLVVIVNEILMK